MIDPATMGTGSPRPRPMPMSAMPTVPAVDHELPVASDTMAQIRQEVTRKMDGEMSRRP